MSTWWKKGSQKNVEAWEAKKNIKTWSEGQKIEEERQKREAEETQAPNVNQNTSEVTTAADVGSENNGDSTGE